MTRIRPRKRKSNVNLVALGNGPCRPRELENRTISSFQPGQLAASHMILDHSTAIVSVKRELEWFRTESVEGLSALKTYFHRSLSIRPLSLIFLISELTGGMLTDIIKYSRQRESKTYNHLQHYKRVLPSKKMLLQRSSISVSAALTSHYYTPHTYRGETARRSSLV